MEQEGLGREIEIYIEPAERGNRTASSSHTTSSAIRTVPGWKRATTVKMVYYTCAVLFKNFLLVAWYEGISSMEISHLHFACHCLCLLYIFQGILWSITIMPLTRNGRSNTLPRISSCLLFQSHITYGFHPVMFGVYWLLYGRQAQNVGFDVSVWSYD